MAWQSMMERSPTNMHYQAWRHEPTVGVGGLIYQSWDTAALCSLMEQIENIDYNKDDVELLVLSYK